MSLEPRPVLRASLVAVALSPFLLTLARAALPLGTIGDAAHGLFAIVCHQRVDRTLSLAGVLMPVCSRCAGIFAGVGLAALLARPRLGSLAARALLAAAGLVMLADVVMQELGVHPLWHTTRLLTGVFVGYTCVLTVLAYLATTARPATVEVFRPEIPRE